MDDVTSALRPNASPRRSLLQPTSYKHDLSEPWICQPNDLVTHPHHRGPSERSFLLRGREVPDGFIDEQRLALSSGLLNCYGSGSGADFPRLLRSPDDNVLPLPSVLNSLHQHPQSSSEAPRSFFDSYGYPAGLLSNLTPNLAAPSFLYTKSPPPLPSPHPLREASSSFSFSRYGPHIDECMKPIYVRALVNQHAAVDFLGAAKRLATAQQCYKSAVEDDVQEAVVFPEDKMLVSDYLYHLVGQLKLCRFEESDRKTRGGRRQNLNIGFGGLECRHCASDRKSRKFFWTNADRLATSFSEIEGHVMRCPRCPSQILSALKDLKLCHLKQRNKLPRGAQKVFFRRVWRRLHTDDPGIIANPSSAASSIAHSPPPQEEDVKQESVPDARDQSSHNQEKMYVFPSPSCYRIG